MRELPSEKVAQVEDFIDFLRQREADSRLTHTVAKMSEKAFAEVWGNPADADYDRL